MSEVDVRRTKFLLAKELKKKIKGSIHLEYTEPFLIISLYAVNDIVYRRVVIDFDSKISSLSDIKSLADSILYDYHEYIENLYFM